MPWKKQRIKKGTRYAAFARHYDFFTSPFERRTFSKWRKQFLPKLKGRILEIGVGTGKSLDYYGKNAEVIGIDSSSEMLKIARRRLKEIQQEQKKSRQEAKKAGAKIILRKISADALQFKDSSFDHVVTFFMFCSLRNPKKSMSEICRVLKPGCRAILIEHVLSKKKPTALVQHIINPFTKLLINDNVASNTKQLILDAGFKIVKEKDLAMGDVFRMFVVEKRNNKGPLRYYL